MRLAQEDILRYTLDPGEVARLLERLPAGAREACPAMQKFVLTDRCQSS